MEQSLLLLEKLDAKNLPELKGIKESQLKLVEENPYIEIVDNKTYEKAKKRRTALLKGRTSLETQEKTIASKLSNFRKQVGTVTKELIDITLPHEEKQQEEVKRYEQIKENERLEKERLENERIEKIKSKIYEFENYAYSKINSWNFDILKIQDDYTEIILESVSGFDFEEFDILFQQAKLRVQEHAQNKINSLSAELHIQQENERLAREKAKADAKLKEIQEQQEKERVERESKELEQKNQMFEIRKKRLNDIGVILTLEGLFKYLTDDYDYVIATKPEVYNADLIVFENIMSDAIITISKAKEEVERVKAEKEAQEKAEIEAKKKADKENKERQKRLSLDKKLISESLEVYFADLHFATENKETKDFIENANTKIQNLKIELLTELENL